MATPTDAGHRPHTDLKGQEPNWHITNGPEGITVELQTWGPQDFELPMLNALMANWGGDMDCPPKYGRLSADAIDYLERCMDGGTLQQILEGLTFWFKIDGVSRATTHQLVRTRVGAAMMQHGGRDNDWRNRNWTMPETIRRAMDEHDTPDGTGDAMTSCIQDWDPINQYLESHGCGGYLQTAVLDVLSRAHDLYAALVDAGIPWQDARRLLPMGTQTYIFIQYNYLALRGLLANRLEPDMDWEINCVAQLMVREMRRHTPELLWRPLRSASDKAGVDLHSLMSSWTPTLKHPPLLGARALDRAHRPEQNPFWILAPESIDGGPVCWIPTNGQWPQEEAKKLEI